MPEPIVVKQEFDAPAEKLWNAITDQDEMVKWYFAEITDFQPAVGHRIEFVVVVEDRKFVHQWEVTEVEPGRRISYTWKYGGIPGEGAVTWKVSDHGKGSSLRLTNTGIETFPQHDPLFHREAGANGWRYFIKDRLKSFLDD